MKTSIPLLFLTSCVASGDAALPDFSTKLDPDGTLSLSSAFGEKRSIQMPSSLLGRSERVQVKKLVSHMPVVAPKESVDQKMPIGEPNPAVDYAMIVKEPEVVSEK